MNRLNDPFEQFPLQRTYLKNVTPATIEWYRCAWTSFHQSLAVGSRLSGSRDRWQIFLDGRELHLGEIAGISKPDPLDGSLDDRVRAPSDPMIILQLADDHNTPTRELP